MLTEYTRLMLDARVIRQWIENQKLYREREEREPSRFELLIDLIFVSRA